MLHSVPEQYKGTKVAFSLEILTQFHHNLETSGNTLLAPNARAIFRHTKPFAYHVKKRPLPHGSDSCLPGRTPSSQQSKDDRQEDDQHHDTGGLAMEGANAQVPVPVDADAWRLAGQGWQWHSSSCGSCSHSSRDLCLAGDECRHPSADSQEGQQGSTQQLRSAACHLHNEQLFTLPLSELCKKNFEPKYNGMDPFHCSVGSLTRKKRCALFSY